MSDDPDIPSDEASRNQAEERRELAERNRERAEEQRQILESFRREREELRDAEEAARVVREANRVASDIERGKILAALRENAENLASISVQMKAVEDMRQALYKLIGNTKNDTQ